MLAKLSPLKAALIASIGLSNGVHADFGSGLWDGSRIGIPYVVVNGKIVLDNGKRTRERPGRPLRHSP